MTDYSFWNESDFWIGDIPLNYIDENGCKWMIQDVDGWWELPPPEIPDDTRPYSDDGDYYVAGRYAARTVTIKGRIIPPVTANRQVVTDARDRLSSTLNSVRKTLVFKVMEPRYPKQANVQINSVPTMVINDYNNHVEFTIQFKASDPRKYSAEMHNISAQLAGKSEWGRRYPRQFYYTYGDVPPDGTIYANNNGDYHTYGVIRISGPVTNPSLLHVESNSTLKFNIVLGTDDYLDVNLRARTVRLNGKQFKRSSLTTDSKWFTLLPGENSIRFRGTQHIAAKKEKEEAINIALNPNFQSSIVDTNNIVGTNLVATPQPTSTYDMDFGMSGGGSMGGIHYVNEGPISSITSHNRISVTGVSDTNPSNYLLPGIVVKPNSMYSWSIYVTASRTVDLAPVLFFSGGQGVLKGGTVTVTAGEWTRISMQEVAGDNATMLRPGVQLFENQPEIVGGYIGVTGGLLERSTSVDDYYDGSTGAGAVLTRWSGTANNSISYKYQQRLDRMPTLGSSLVPFQTKVWRQARNTVDPETVLGYLAAIKPDPVNDTTNETFAVPSAQITSSSGESYENAIQSRIVDLWSQGITPGRSYTALVTAIVPKTMTGMYTNKRYVNYAVNGTPGGNFTLNWSRPGFNDQMRIYDFNPVRSNGYARVQVSGDSTQIATSEIRYKQNKELIPESSKVTFNMSVRTNRELPVRLVVEWYNGEDLIRTTRGDTSTTESGEWVNLEVVSSSPIAFSRVEIYSDFSPINSNEKWDILDYVDAKDVMIQVGDDLSEEFFDGFSENTDINVHNWIGKAEYSASERLSKEGGEQSLHEYARSLVFFALKPGNNGITSIDTDSVVKDSAPNSPGIYNLRIEFTTPEDYESNMFVSLWNGSPSTADMIYFDELTIVEGSYSGEFFDGSSDDARWMGATYFSQSQQSQVVGVPEAEALVQYRSAWIS